MSKKRTWKSWAFGSLLVLLLLGTFWLTNLIWFRPFNIEHFYDRIFVEVVFDEPETATQLGVPILYDWTKDELDDISDAKRWEGLDKMKENYATLMSYDFESQSKENQLNTKILGYFLKGIIDEEPFFYHSYSVNQMAGVQSNLPAALQSFHRLKSESDVEAYIARLSKFDIKFDQLIEGLKISEAKKVIPPKFVIESVLDEMKGFIGQKKDVEEVGDDKNPVENNILFTNFMNKIDQVEDLSEEAKLAYQKQVEKEIQTTVFNAYKKLIVYFEDLYTKANTDAGVWKLPDGDKYYAYQLRQHTTTNLTPEEIHQIGLREVARVKEEISEILVQEGYVDSTKTLGEIIQGLSKEERFLYPENEKGRKLLIAEYKAILNEIDTSLSEVFDLRPKASLDVARVPEFKEEGAPKAYYHPPAMDASRPGIFYANLRKVQEHPRYSLKTLAYHEGVPGHHFQIGIQEEMENVPIFRMAIPFTAYQEGWALYAEQLAWELGFYENDPFGNLGRLQAELCRAARLVIDSGIHYKKWTREEAIEYMVENTGLSTTEVVTEVERYIVLPGQACSYKIGMMKILELREKVKKAQGDDFDLKKFHNLILNSGPVPLGILEEIVDDYIKDILP